VEKKRREDVMGGIMMIRVKLFSKHAQIKNYGPLQIKDKDTQNLGKPKFTNQCFGIFKWVTRFTL